MPSDVRDHPYCSVIVPVFNGGRSLCEQADALLRQNFSQPWEIIFVDNGSSDGSQEVIRKLPAQPRVRIRLIDGSQKRGQVYARNLGAENAASDLLVFHDQDDLADSGWLAEIIRVLEGAEAVGGFVEVTGAGDAPTLGRVPASESLPTIGGITTALGTNFAIRRNIFNAIGRWRHIGVYAGEDVDICARLQKAGYMLKYAPRARVIWRSRSDFAGVFRQGTAYGRADVIIYQLWRNRGAERPGWSSIGRQWRRCMRRGLARPFSRRNWLNQTHLLGISWGRLHEGLRAGVIGPMKLKPLAL